MNNNVSWKKIFLMITIIGLFYAGITSVFGVQGASLVTNGSSTRFAAVNTSSSNVLAQAGNVTQINVSGNQVTTHWTGFFGNISGNITLGDSAGNIFYDWSGLTGAALGEVIASNDSSVDWTTIACMNTTVKDRLEANLGITGSDPDRVNNTYPNNVHADFTLAGVAFNDCNSTNAYVNSASQSTTYFQMLLMDDQDDPVYVTTINDSLTGFNGEVWDFQLLVGQSDLETTTTMYFYIELD